MGDGADKGGGGLYSKWFIVQMTGSLVSSQLHCHSSPEGKRKENRKWGAVTGHAVRSSRLGVLK